MSKAREIADYLRNNPGFFEDHQELLTELDLATAQSAPFHQRQLEVLRERQEFHRARLDLIVDTARNNEELQQGLHETAVALLALEGQETAREVAHLIRLQFSVDAVEIYHGAQCEAGVDYADLAHRVAHLSSICDDRVSSRLREELFPGDSRIQSCAFVPLAFAGELVGVMVLGSRDEERFTPGMGVLFLDRLGELAGSLLARTDLARS